MADWPHQTQGLKELNALLDAGYKRVCVTSPTGGGKSKMLFDHLLQHGLPSAVYTDRRMLLDQLGAGLDDAGICYGVRASGHDPRLLDDVQLCMLQTEVSRVLKTQRREVHPAKRVYLDEAHKQASGGALEIAEMHEAKGAVLIGLTATPLGIGHMYDKLVIAGTNSQLRQCGALVPAYHYGPDEPDTRWIGKVAVGEGECGIAESKRMIYCSQVFGRIIDKYHEYNPTGLPSILFAPGVQESLWFAKQLTARGIPAAHIDGSNVWVDGQEVETSSEARQDILDRSEAGEIKVICNRFVMREGINAPWICHGILATVFGSLTAYIQAGGRFLRAHPGKTRCTIQDHGGNWWRHGSLNADRKWKLGHTDRIVAGVREASIRERKEPEPIVCPKCGACRLSGPECPKCHLRYTTRTRMVLQRDGSLREMRGDIFRQRRVAEKSPSIEQDWIGRVTGVRKSKKPHVQKMTFAQIEATFARDHNWQYPPRDLPLMPVRPADWFRPVVDVTELTH